MFENLKIASPGNELQSVPSGFVSSRVSSLLIDLEVEIAQLSEDLRKGALVGNSQNLIVHLQILNAEISVIRPLLSEPRVRDTRHSLVAATAEQITTARAKRCQFLPPSLFCDTAWGILLQLTVAHEAQTKVPISALADKVGVPISTASRWIDSLVDHRLVTRVQILGDKSQSLAELSERGAGIMGCYLAQCRDDMVAFARSDCFAPRAAI